MKLLLLLCTLPMFSQTPKNLELFLLIGQSNMAGRGVVEPPDQQPIAGVWMLTKDDQWAPAIDPMHFDRPAIIGVGLGRSFAQALLKATPGKQIGLIPAAMGGSALDEWKPTQKNYTEAVRRAKAAMKDGRLRGILWHQGEADAADPERALTYKQRWLAVMASLRQDLNAETVPVVTGELGHFLYTRPKNDYPFARDINTHQALIPLSTPRTGWVSSAGLTAKDDQLHFNSPSLREFGRRYALAFLALDPTW